MKKRVWASSPIFFVILAIMFAMTAATYFIGQTALFYVELGVSVVATIAVAVSLHFFETYVGGAVKSAKKALGGWITRPCRILPWRLPWWARPAILFGQTASLSSA